MQNVMQLNHPRLDVEGQAFEDEVFNLQLNMGSGNSTL